MTEEFKLGDIVQLKTGSPAMIIRLISGSGEVKAIWFNTVTGKIEEERIEPFCLVKVLPDTFNRANEHLPAQGPCVLGMTQGKAE